MGNIRSRSIVYEDVDDLIQKGYKQHQAGDLASASEIYRSILDRQPEHIDANFLLGTLNMQQEDLDEATVLLKKAIALKPDHVEAYNKLAIVFQKQGKLIEAIEIFNQILSIGPENANVYFNLGNLYNKLNKYDMAVESFGKTIFFKPNDHEAHNNLGAILRKMGKFDEAVESYKTALKLKPDYTEAHFNIGNVFKDLNILDDAVASYRQALALEPDYAIAISSLGNVLLQQGKTEEAIASLKQAIVIKPDYAEAHNNLGMILSREGRHEEALSSFNNAIKLKPEDYRVHSNVSCVLKELDRLDEAVASCNRSIKLNPHYAEAHINLGVAFQEQGKLSEAISSYQNALQLGPDYAKAHYNLGTIFYLQEKHDEALSCYQKALQLKPDYAEVYVNIGNMFKVQGKTNEALSNYKEALRLKPGPGVEVKASLILPVINESRESINQYRENIFKQIKTLKAKGITIDDPVKQVDSTNFYLVYHGFNDREIQKMIASFYIHACPDLVWTSPNLKNNRMQPHDKINIGIISNFLYGHTIGVLNHGIIKHLSRERFYVKLFRFPSKEDPHSKAINSAADEVIVLSKRLKPAREEIAVHSLDILFYLDIGMDPLTFFLAFSRLAPVQCVTWGHPVTTGIPNMDYFISSDNAEPPDAGSHYTERLALLDRLAIYYFRPQMPDVLQSRKYFGLGEDNNLYVCLQTLYKFHPDFDNVLGDILRRDSRGLLVLIEGKHKHLTELLRSRFSCAFPDVIDRVRFLPRMSTNDYLSLIKTSDVVLDTPCFGGGNTSLEAFACGIPVVTWPGEFLRSRLTLALYKQMGIMDCVADNAKTYLDIAFRIANDRTWRDGIIEKINARADCLYEDIEIVHQLECFFEKAVEEARNNNLTT